MIYDNSHIFISAMRFKVHVNGSYKGRAEMISFFIHKKQKNNFNSSFFPWL